VRVVGFIVRTCFKGPESLVFAGRGELPVGDRSSDSFAASSASAICFAIGNASSTGMAPRAMRWRQVLAVDEFHYEDGQARAFFEL
jgi:hypothetical protein